jgi:hypothetical protein
MYLVPKWLLYSSAHFKFEPIISHSIVRPPSRLPRPNWITKKRSGGVGEGEQSHNPLDMRWFIQI